VKYFLYALVIWSTSLPAVANWNDDYLDAQICMNDKARARDYDTLPCIAGIIRYSDPQMSTLKCGARLTDQGFDFFQFPWMLLDNGEYPWLTIIRKISRRNFLDRDTARTLRTDCQRTHGNARLSKVAADFYDLLGTYYWLRALLIEVGSHDMRSATLNLPSIQSQASIQELEEAIDSIVRLCKGFPYNAPMPIRLTLPCAEPLGLQHRSGTTTFEKFLSGLAAY
jgi:hypothetical protein